MQADTMHLPAPPTRVLCPCHPLNNQAGAPVSGPYPAIISVSNTLSPEGDTTPSLLPLRSQHKQRTNLQTSLLKPSTFPSLLTLHPSTLPLIFSCRAHKNIWNYMYVSLQLEDKPPENRNFVFPADSQFLWHCLSHGMLSINTCWMNEFSYSVYFHELFVTPGIIKEKASVQFSSAAQSCPILCDPMNHSTPGLPVHHQLLEFTQTHIHRVSDAIQPSHPLLSPSLPAPNPSQH